MIASQRYCVEIDLKPIDEKCGMPTEAFGEPAIYQPPSIPWSYNRHQIPDLFARKGVSLDAWERAVDSAEILFKDRNAALEQENRENECVCHNVFLPLYILSLSLSMTATFLVPLWSDHLFFKISLLCGIVCLQVSAPIFLIRRNRLQYPIILNRISSLSEEQWSDQVTKLNDLYEQYGINVVAYTREVDGRGVDLPWSVGFVFSFKIQPSNQEEAARLLAHSQTSGVSDDTFRRRLMRVVPEESLMHIQPEAIGVTSVPGGNFAMAVAVVVENGDDDWNTEEVSEKKTLLDVV